MESSWQTVSGIGNYTVSQGNISHISWQIPLEICDTEKPPYRFIILTVRSKNWEKSLFIYNMMPGAWFTFTLDYQQIGSVLMLLNFIWEVPCLILSTAMSYFDQGSGWLPHTFQMLRYTVSETSMKLCHHQRVIYIIVLSWSY
jgi:hypothetical protein